MMFLPKILVREGDEDQGSDRRIGPPNEPPITDDKAHPTSNVEAHDSDSSDDVQEGVREIEATVKVWSSIHIYVAYALIWLVYFADSMHSSVGYTLTSYVTSDFSVHGLTPTTNVLSQLIGGLFKLPLAKILDIWGRPQGVALTVFLMVVGLVMMAACQNIETYAAAQVFYWIGFNGVAYSLQVFTADTSELKNRAFVFAFINSPFIISTPISAEVANAYVNKGAFSWRWVYGIFCIVVPVVTAPIFFLFLWNHRKAKRMGVLQPKKSSGRTTMESIKHYCVEFDAFGLLLAAAGMALFLLPFNIYSYQDEGWRSPMIICMLVFGVVLLVAFALYEKHLAPIKFIPYELLMDRTIIGACITVTVAFVSFFIWSAMFPSFLQVVTGASLKQATWVGRIYNMVSCAWGLVVGMLIRWSGRFKWLALYVGVPMQILGVGLMVHFRQPGRDLGYIIMTQIFIAVAGGTMVICEEIAIMAVVAHKHVAVVLAMYAMFSSIGGAIGSTLATAIWNGVFPSRLQEYLPAETKKDAPLIVANLTRQLSYPSGSPTGMAIQQSYGEAQRIMLASATALLVITILSVAMWRDIPVKDFKQRKGAMS
ncbi:hypothetical protein EsDP_00006528 [Epichloe bromicola]|uniref:Major facilitator superfamily (MFS) profile domain-containing protein n=1 Tax=Epichloe bromicola TaxID=79588 RepID=A0ABQ0CXY2_9HYPO